MSQQISIKDKTYNLLKDIAAERGRYGKTMSAVLDTAMMALDAMRIVDRDIRQAKDPSDRCFGCIVSGVVALDERDEANSLKDILIKERNTLLEKLKAIQTICKQ